MTIDDIARRVIAAMRLRERRDYRGRELVIYVGKAEWHTILKDGPSYIDIKPNDLRFMSWEVISVHKESWFDISFQGLV